MVKDRNIEDNKLLYLFNQLNNKQINKFIIFSKSEFVNKNYDVSRVFEYFFKQNVIGNYTLDKNLLHQYIYNEKPYNDLRIRHLLSMATEIVENFIVYQNVIETKVYKEKILLDQYIHWNQEKYIRSTTTEIQKLYQDRGVFDADFYLSQYHLHMQLYHLQSSNVRTKDFDFQDTVHYLSIYSIIEILKSACTVNAIQKVTETKIEQPLLAGVLEFLPKSNYIHEPLVFIYYYLYLLIENDQEEVFQELLQQIQNNEHLFSHKDLNTLYRTLINYCIRKSNQNRLEYTRSAFEIYIYGIRQGALIERNEINRFIFTNVITLGIKLNDLETCMQFLQEYKGLLQSTIRENTIDYNLAKIQYAQRQLDAALKILLTNEFKDKIWNLNSKYLILKILFEQDDLETFKQHLNAFKIYVKRIQNIGYHKTYFENVVIALTALLGKKLGKKKYLNYTFDSQTPDFEWFHKWG